MATRTQIHILTWIANRGVLKPDASINNNVRAQKNLLILMMYNTMVHIDTSLEALFATLKCIGSNQRRNRTFLYALNSCVLWNKVLTIWTHAWLAKLVKLIFKRLLIFFVQCENVQVDVNSWFDFHQHKLTRFSFSRNSHLGHLSVLQFCLTQCVKGVLVTVPNF